MVFVWAKQETVLAVLKKCPRCLVHVRQYATVFSVGPCLYFINREDRRYTKKMTLANKSAIFLYFYSFSAYYAFLWRDASRLLFLFYVCSPSRWGFPVSSGTPHAVGTCVQFHILEQTREINSAIYRFLPFSKISEWDPVR